MSIRILIIDDDRDLCILLQEFFSLEGINVSALHDGADALSHCRTQSYDAIVLDIMLPGLPGLDVLRQLREFSNTPVLMLTARGDTTDRIVGLELGADDYLSKPCDPRELTARLRAILRRAHDGQVHGKKITTAGQTHIDSAARHASFADTVLDLTSAEFNILELLVQSAGHVVDKEVLSQQALGRSLTAYDRSIDVHISKIRKKLALAGGDNLIVSVRGSGYQFRLESCL